MVPAERSGLNAVEHVLNPTTPVCPAPKPSAVRQTSRLGGHKEPRRQGSALYLMFLIFSFISDSESNRACVQLVAYLLRTIRTYGSYTANLLSRCRRQARELFSVIHIVVTCV